MNPTKDLYTTTDVKRVREFLFSEQEGYDACTGLDLPPEKACLDHDHTSQLVRGVLHRNVNALIGVIENNYKRHLRSWYTYDLPSFLRQAADYLEKEDDLRFHHPSHQKRNQADYNKLNEAQKDLVLSNLGYPTGTNGKERKDIFKQALLDRSLGYVRIKEAINNVKESTT